MTTRTYIDCLIDNFDSLTRLQVARINDNLFPNIDAGNNLSEIVVLPARSDRFLEGFSILNDDHFLDTGKSDDGIVRNCHSHLRVVGHDLSAHKRSGSQRPIISYVRFNHEHTVLLGDHRTESHDLSEVNILITLDGYTNILARANSA